MKFECEKQGADDGLNRRSLLKSAAAGFGGLALSGLFADEVAAMNLSDAAKASLNPLAEKLPHFAPRAKRVIFLFMHGGPSQMDTFDYKPQLQKDDNKPMPFAGPRVTFAGKNKLGKLLGSPFKFKQYGQCGKWVSSLFPHVGSVVDDLCFVHSLHGSNPAHGGALMKIHTGSDVFVRPSMGSWISYGLGTENENLPSFITICPTLGHGGVGNYSSSFLPAAHHGTAIGHAGVKARNSTINHLTQKRYKSKEQKKLLELLRQMNQSQLKNAVKDQALEGRIASFELAFKMQMAAPDVLDFKQESAAVKQLYGIDEKHTENFGTQCLMARRLSEKGVRFVQCTHSYKWDQHGSLRKKHTSNALEVDKPIAGLIKDLKSRGQLDDTLVIWGGEFGRTSISQGGRDGRDHNPHGFTWFLAGGGTKPGLSYGATDEYGYYAKENKVHIHDMHATILHLLGLNHEKLTYRQLGRDFRLTDVAGHVVKDIMI